MWFTKPGVPTIYDCLLTLASMTYVLVILSWISYRSGWSKRNLTSSSWYLNFKAFCHLKLHSNVIYSSLLSLVCHYKDAATPAPSWYPKCQPPLLITQSYNSYVLLLILSHSFTEIHNTHIPHFSCSISREYPLTSLQIDGSSTLVCTYPLYDRGLLTYS